MRHDPTTHLQLMKDRQRDDRERVRQARLARLVCDGSSFQAPVERTTERTSARRRILGIPGRLACSFAILRW